MNRRTFLLHSGILGTLALAGCTTEGDTAGPGDETSPTDTPTETPTDTETPTNTETTTVTVTDSAVETTEASCGPGDGSADVSIEEETVDFSGRIHAPTPCYEVVVESTAYDHERDELTVVLDVEDTGELCVECVGSLVFEGSVSFEGTSPGDATIRYDGGVVASTRDDVETPTERTPTLVSTSFDLTDGGSEGVTDEADVRFDTETETVVVTGTIPGKNGCMTATLGDVEYDDAADCLSVDVVTIRREGTEGDACTEQILPLSYEARFSFEGGLPATVEVSHDGDGLLSTAHESVAAGGPVE